MRKWLHFSVWNGCVVSVLLFAWTSRLNAAECLKFGQERIAILDVTANGKKIAGTAELLGTGMRRMKSTVSGIVYPGGRPSRPEDSLADGAFWPGHRGPFGSGAALDKGHRLVDDLNKARPVWKCAEDLPDGRAHHSGGGPLGSIRGDASCVDWLRHSGAKGGPVVADGRVFLYTLVPSGKVPDGGPVVAEFDRAVLSQAAHDWMPGQVKPSAKLPKIGEETKEPDSEFDLDIETETKPNAPPPKPRFYPQRTMFCVGADDVFFCFDARTGATLWKTVYPGASANYGGSKGGPHLSAFVWDGKVYAMGSTERIYCLDAKTGKEIWQSHTGWSATCKYKVLQDCLASGEGFPRNRSLETALTVADGVVVCLDQRNKVFQHDGYGYTRGPGAIGLDASTGKRLWQTGEAISADSTTPCRWHHKGKTYILLNSAVEPATLRAIDPRTGKDLWKAPAGSVGMGLVADEDHVVTHNKNGAVTCFRITPEKAEKVWTLDRKYRLPGSFCYPVIYRGHLYFPPGGEHSLICVRLSDGEIVAECPNLGGGHTGGGHFLIAGEGRTLCSGVCVTGIEEDTKPLQAPWRIPFAIGYLTPMDPALADGRFFVRDKTGLVCYDLRAGKGGTQR